MCAYATPFLISNQLRPLTGSQSVFKAERLDQLFRQRPALGSAYEGAARVIRSSGCSEVGLELNWDDWEYPFWALLPRVRGNPVHLEHVRVTNFAGQFESRRAMFAPCVVVRAKGPSYIGYDPTVPDAFQLAGGTYSRRWSNAEVNPRVDVYLRDG